MRGRPKAQLVLTQVEFEQFTALTLRRKTAQALALRARIVLACVQDIDNRVVASRQRNLPVADGGIAHLARIRTAAPSTGDLQALQRSAVR